MYAAQLVGPGRVELNDVPIPLPDDDQVLVRMTAASICGSDLHQVFGDFGPTEYPGVPGAPGHEGIGYVEDSRSPLFRAGDPVLTVPHPKRATCFAEYQVAEAWSLVKLAPDHVTHRVLMAQQLGTVVYAMKKFWPGTAGRCATVIGGGSAGLFFLQLLKERGFESVILSDPVRARRQVAVDLGADAVVDPTTESLAEVATGVTDGAGPNLVIEAAGTGLAREHAIEAAPPGGRVGLFGFPQKPGTEQFPLADAWRKMLTLVASANTQLEPGISSFHQAVRMISSGGIPVDHLVVDGSRDLLDNIQDAFEAARDNRVNKVILDLPTE